MVISAIIKQSVIYISAHAEQSYTGTYLADKGDANTNVESGIYGQELTRETLTSICEYVQTASADKTMDLVINFDRIKDVQINQRPAIVALKGLVRHLLFRNISPEVVKKLEIDIYVQNQLNAGNYPLFHVSDQDADLALVPADKLFDERLVALLVAHSHESRQEDGLHQHPPIYLTKFVDVKAMMVADTSFFMYIIYRLALQMTQKTEWSNPAEKPVLFCQNMNSAFIATVLSGFLQWDLLSMDHIGPVNKVYTNIGSKIKSDARYIVVSDMVCLGTEVRICQNIINYSGGQYVGNVSIVKVNTLKFADERGDSLSAFQISKNNNPIDYKILTALDS